MPEHIATRLAEYIQTKQMSSEDRVFPLCYTAEIISKVILRHQDPKTAQIYLGKIGDTEAIKWMNILHGR